MPNIPWSVTWRKALVSAPRILPDSVLRFTSPQGPQPFVVKLPSRGDHLIPVYVFLPPPQAESEAQDLKFPILVDFHGGGFVLGSCHEQAPFCAKLCRELNCVAMSVDYRLGPYAQFPAALEDAEDVINALLKIEEPGFAKLRSAISNHLSSQRRPDITLDTDRIALSGFSSGGNLALNLVMNMNVPEAWPSPFPESHAKEIPVLMYFAATDLRKLPSEREIIAGFHDMPKSFIVRLELEQHLMPTYLPADMRMHLRASPALADVKDGGLHRQARCLLLLAEKDALSIPNEEWLRKCQRAGRGKDVTVAIFMGMNHGWTQFPDSWLDSDAHNKKYEAHNKAVDFVRSQWEQIT